MVKTKIAKFLGQRLFVHDLVVSFKKRWNNDPKHRFKISFFVALYLILIIALSVLGPCRKEVRTGVTGTAPAATELKEEAQPQSVHIFFGVSAAKLEDVGKAIKRGLTISPAIAGQWRWVSDRQITFTPDEDWAVGEDYLVKLDKSLFPEHVRLETYEYLFRSAPFVAAITQAEFYQDPRLPKVKKVVATIKFSHPVDPTELESRIKMRLIGGKGGFLGLGKDRDYPFTVGYDKFKGEAYIHSDPIEPPENDALMEVEILDGVRSLRGGPPTRDALKSKVVIPGMLNFFRIQSVDLTLVRNERYEPEQVLVIETTAGILEENMRKNLEVYLLPQNRPAKPGQEAAVNYSWSNPAEIGPEELTLSQRLEIVPIPTDKEYATLHSFKHETEVGRYLYIRLRKGVEAWGGYILAQDYSAIRQVPPFPKELSIMQEGAILSLSGEQTISLLSRGLSAIRFEIGRVVSGQINHLVSQSKGDFRSPRFNYNLSEDYYNDFERTLANFGEENITERFTEIRTLENLGPAKTHYTAFNLSRYLGEGAGPKGLFFVKVEGWDPIEKRSLEIHDRRLILITDLGILVKDNKDDSHDVFVQSIPNGVPVAGASVEVLGKNGLPVARRLSDESGHASFPSLADFQREKEPTLYLVRKDGDVSFLPYHWTDRYLQFSRFDIGGIVDPGFGEGLAAYLFSDRGIYRPGDEIRVGIIVKAADWQQNISGIPLELVVKDARGLEVYKHKFNLAASGFEEFKYLIEEVAPTGEWPVELYVAKDEHRRSLLGSTAIRVEEFLPDRLRITTRLSAERPDGWVSPEELKAFVSLQNLFGTPAQDRRIAAALTLTPGFPRFEKYRDYSFHDPLRAERSFTERLQDQSTNENGETEFDLNLSRYAKATYRLRFTAEGFEAQGGRSVTSESAVLVSPLKMLIGLKPDGELQFIHRESQRSVHLIALDSELKTIAVSGLKAQTVEVRYISTLVQQPNMTYKYETIKKEIPRSQKEITIPAAGLAFPLPTQEPGDYALAIRDADELELNRVQFSVIGAANLTRSLEKTAELQVALNKTDYAPGEEIELQIKAPYAGAGLITIEQDKIYAHKWFKTTTNTTVERIRVPGNLEANGYVNVAFVRSINSREIFMSPLSYGVVPFSVSRQKRTNPISLVAPKIARPGETLNISYKSERPGKIVIFAVDEGILQVAGYKTPDPLGYFFKKRALEVRTAQILDLILPEYNLVRSFSAPGGDAEEEPALGRNLNPFKRRRDKPVVFWSGILQTDAQERKITYEVPDYFNGTLRVMAVAVSADSIGVAEEKTLVRGPFVLSPNVPTFVVPNDEFIVSIGVANNVEGSGKKAKVLLGLKTSEHLELLSEPQIELSISEGREASAVFRLRAKERFGSANIVFLASHADQKSQASVDLSLRPATPYMTTVSGGSLKSGVTAISLERQMHPHFRTIEVSASSLPLGLAHGLIQYLEKFPYGCTEQLVSQAFPAIVLRHRPEFGYSPEKVETNLKHAMRILSTRQNVDGAFGFWTAGSYYSNEQSVYALHFITEAKDKGYPVYPDLLQKGIVFLRRLIASDPNSLADARVRAYGIYILSRNGVGSASYISSLRSWLDANAKGWEKDLTAVYLAGAYRLHQQHQEANSLISHNRLGKPQETDYEHFYDSLAHDAQLLYILSKHFPERLSSLKGENLLAIVEPIIKGSFNTMSSAYTILALDAYVSAGGNLAPAEIAINEVTKSGQKKRLALPPGAFPHAMVSPQAVKIEIANRSGQLIFYQVTQAGFDLTDPKEIVQKKLEVHREYRDEANGTANSAKLGSEIAVHLRMRAIDGSTLANVAIVDLLPGGFEVVEEPRLLEFRRTPSAAKTIDEEGEEEHSGGDGWRPDYVDIREDRVVIFGSVGPSSQEFVYRIKATNNGKYKAPPIFAEGMYDRRAQARGLSSVFVVE